MKKLQLICLLGFCLLLPLTGLARAQLTWEQRATSKLTRSVLTYVVEQGEDGTPLVREAGSLPAGTHVVFCDYDRDTQLCKIIHNNTGSETAAWIRDRDALVSTIVRVNFSDNTYLDFPEALVNDRAALLRILRQMFPNRTITPIEGSATFHMSEKGQAETASGSIHENNEQGKPASKQDQPADSSSKTPAHKAASEAKNGMLEARFGNQTVLVEQLGLVQSIISAGGEKKSVPTADLVLYTPEPGGIQVAVIHAPQTGKCSLRAAAAAGGKMIKQCKAGTIVQVLSIGKEYSKIVYRDTEGFVLSACLYHPEALSNGYPQSGVLAYKGKTNGSTTVNLRNSPDKASAKVAEWRTGVPVTIVSHTDGWVMIEANGIAGYVMEGFVLPDEH